MIRVAVERLSFTKKDTLSQQWDIHSGRIGRWYIIRKKHRWVRLGANHVSERDGWIGRKLFVHPSSEHIDNAGRKADKTSSIILADKFTDQLVVWLVMEGHIKPEDM